MNSISVCICTFRRPLLLKKCVESVLHQHCSEDIEIIIVDNDPDASAKQIYQEIKILSTKKISYYHEQIPNIANARNRCVKEAKGYWIAFIDDDEYAEPQWLHELLATAVERSADAVWGPVVYAYAEGTPDFIKNTIKGGRINKNGLINQHLSAGNVLVKRSILLSLPGPFNTSFGSSGGEDSELFHSLLTKGALFWSNSKAIVYEEQGAERSHAIWHLERSYRSGWTRTKIILKSHNTIYSILTIVLKSFFGLCKYTIYSLKDILHPRKAVFLFLLGVMYQFGRMSGLFNDKYDHYGA